MNVRTIYLSCAAFIVAMVATVSLPQAQFPTSSTESRLQTPHVRSSITGIPSFLPRYHVPAPGKSSNDSLPLPSTLSSPEYQRILYKFLQERRYDRPDWGRDKGVRDTGPWIDGKYYGTHNAVRIYYSPEVMQWLKGGRRGRIPDGAMIVKEMFNPPAARYDSTSSGDLNKQVNGLAVMVRDSMGAKDGWYWSFWAPGQLVDSADRYPYDYPNSGFGEYCVRCHASAAEEFTFSATRNIEGFPGDPVLFRVDDSWRTPLASTPPAPASHASLADNEQLHTSIHKNPLPAPDKLFLSFFKQIPPISLSDVEHIPPLTYDHVIAGPTGPGDFITSDQCLSCHDGQPGNLGPNMYLPDSGGVNLSPYGEWNWSMMGLAGRDPIFYAQLESERTLQPKHEKTIQNLCFRCHGVMGDRQFAIDHPDDFFLKDFTMIRDERNPRFAYGALARDGVSCTVCHQIVDDHLPLDSIVTGQFHVSKPGEFEPGTSYIYGPFDKPATLAMNESLGMKPVQSDYIKSSRLCASCHSVQLPVFNRQGEQVGEIFEQATYLEWLNSAYQNELKPNGKTPMTCQNCHMPDRYPDRNGTELSYRIANIQDVTYPEVDHRAPLDSVTIPIRPDFVRHTLLGINIFALEMFNQYDDILGVRKTDYMTGSKNGLATAITEADRQAKLWTATVEILDTKYEGNRLRSRVKVTNLTGHRFPSGVGFRRAFIEFTVRDNAGNVLWSSGRTNDVGVIVDENGRPLRSEFHDIDPTTGRQSYQPHYQTVRKENEVQIYEELITSPEGEFTTSFLNLYKTVKDNRLLPLGWSQSGPPGFSFAAETMPHGEALKDAQFMNGSGSDIVEYEIELPRGIAKGANVTATLYYQSIPPSYLRDRFITVPKGKDTQRLHALAGHLNLERSAIKGWKLQVATASASPDHY